MRNFIACISLLFLCHFVFAQNEIDSLKKQLQIAKTDTDRIDLLLNLSGTYGSKGNIDSQLSLANEALQLAQATGNKEREIDAKGALANYWWNRGDYATSIKLNLQVLEFLKSQKDTAAEFGPYAFLMNAYRDQGDYREALSYCFLAMQLIQKDPQCSLCGVVNAATGSVYYGMNDFDSALVYLNKALNYPHTVAMGWIYLMYGRVQAKLKNNTTAFEYYKKSIDTLSSQFNEKDLAGAYNSIGELYNETGHADSAIYYGKQGLNIAKQNRFNKELWQSYLLLASAYEKINTDTAVSYYKLAMAANDTLNNQEKQREISSFKFNEQLHQQELAAQQQQNQNRLRIYLLLGVAFIILLIAFFLYRNNRQKQKAYTLLQKQKDEIDKQKREAEIEAALERVRTKTMAMQKQDDLLDVTDLFAEQLIHLGFDVDVVNFSDGLQYADWDLWMTSPSSQTERATMKTFFPYIDHPYFQKTREGLDRYFKGGSDLNVAVFTKEQKDSFLDYMFENTNLKSFTDESKKYLYSKQGFTFSAIFLKETWVSICKYDTTPFTDEQHNILRRFANAFGQAYTRFLDLQKAEAQAREAQIEAALEKVRSSSLAMHRSKDLAEVMSIVFQQLNALGFSSVIRCWVSLFDKNSTTGDLWITNQFSGEGYPVKIQLPLDGDPFIKYVVEQHFSGAKFIEHFFTTEEGVAYNQALRKLTGDANLAPDDTLTDFPPYTQLMATNKYGHLGFGVIAEVTDEMKNVLSRFSKVFEQAYTRFLDLQKAEAQAREAQIEAALERVRSRSLAVHKSDEFKEVIKVVFDKLQELNLRADAISINTFTNNSDDNEVYFCGKSESDQILFQYHLPHFDSLISNERVTAKKSGLDFFSKTYNKEEKDIFYKTCFELTDLKSIPEEIKQAVLISNSYTISLAIEKHSMIGVNDFAGNILSEKEIDVVKRFARVFEQAYIRFLDLQKAEAQAREAQIEAALEKVRSRSLAMYKSDEIKNVIQLVFEQLIQLNIPIHQVGFVLDYKESDDLHYWSSDMIQPFPKFIHFKSFDHPLFKKYKEIKEKGLDFSTITLSFEDKNSLIKESYKYIHDVPEDIKQTIYNYPGFAQSGFYLNSIAFYALNFEAIPFSEADNAVLKRFANVFEQSYIRFLDLQKAEAATKEAIKQAALDRIRGDIASMRTVADLDKITPIIWNELVTLGVPFIRCGIFIMNEEQGLIHTYLSTPDGKAIAAFNIPYNTPGNIKHVISHWHENKNYIDHWDESAFTEFAATLVDQGALASPEQYLRTIPQGGFYLHFLPFLQGMLYVGNTTALNEEDMNLLQSIAETFATAYARYEDFNKLELAKQQVEKTYSELKSTQAQLIQSEKMASLGELTAGIAHEIQNPLNFVNNFSEVNKELIDELKIKNEQLKIENDEIKELINDIQENEEKINHHGKRADAIVKSMLQHSKQTKGVKEPTDINALCDEYLRLSYHGLRAKDKNFNAEIKTAFDETIGKINIVTQDIGRLLLNLFNNAFYAVNEKTKLQAASYKPQVFVQTKKINNTVEIKVKDNGNGIPPSIKEKIFQPFFTTKPTGQGTGLGLSLSYDIIKAHGGEIKVDTKESEGSIFIIQLPA